MPASLSWLVASLLVLSEGIVLYTLVLYIVPASYKRFACCVLVSDPPFLLKTEVPIQKNIMKKEEHM
jgi:hypothetical protein